GRAERALARAVCAEMHAGFMPLRQALPMNLARAPKPLALPEPARKDVARILALWEDLRARHREGGPYLFGAFSLADCMYLPVATRFQTYQVDLTAHPRARAYLDSLLELPAFVEWRQAALREKEIIADSER
ncbi:MAG TPA: glutathione S-transferase C-terminal domain-containing protein, partial [bacterium]|nr:glutathione S-transferase C-terminal domain-containing protein [bacterium]